MADPSTKTPLSIALILCSSRQPRVCPQIGDFVTETYERWLCTSNTSTTSLTPPPPTLTLIDLAALNLPMFDEPTIPSQIHSASDYHQPHTRAWSLEVQKHSAFIFVTPQYNWGYPAVLKNAIDYLFNEWVGKAAMIVTYGGHGGTKCAGQLKQVLNGVDMKVAETMPALSFPGRGALIKAATGQDIGAKGEGSIWEGQREEVCKAFEELMALVGGPQIVKG